MFNKKKFYTKFKEIKNFNKFLKIVFYFAILNYNIFLRKKTFFTQSVRKLNVFNKLLKFFALLKRLL